MDDNDQEENNSEITTSIQMDARDVNESEMETMKGDTIGDTMYSAKWIINALISLSNVEITSNNCKEKTNTRNKLSNRSIDKSIPNVNNSLQVYEKGWSESLESELCLLWDMTTEKDVTLFLDDNNFLKIAEVSLKVSDSPRMTEILVGILGNMCCQQSVIQSLAEREELVSLLFNLLVVDDTETLIQLLRLLRVAVWDIQLHTAENSNSLWLGHLKNCSMFGTSLIFILNSSTNDDLLIAAVDLVQSISTTKLSDEKLLESLFNVNELLQALLESFTQIIPKQDGNHTRSELKVIENWLTIFTNIVTESSQSIFVENQNESLTNILDTLLRILQPYVHSHNLIPLDERSAVCIHECVNLILRFQQNRLPVGPEIVFIVVTIMFHLKTASKSTDSESNSDNNERELSTYLEKYWFQILDIYEGNQLQDILQMCEENIVKYVMEMTKSHLETTSDKMEKLTIANDSVNQ